MVVRDGVFSEKHEMFGMHQWGGATHWGECHSDMFLQSF